MMLPISLAPMLMIMLNALTLITEPVLSVPIGTFGLQANMADSGGGSSEAFIKRTRFQVPETSRIGDLRKLNCAYELSGATLHAMKLFKDDKEFYRYTPATSGTGSGGINSQEDQRIAFNQPGLKVDIQRSNDHDIWIKIIDKRAAGLYKCQVSVEDSFKSISAEKRMDVSERTRTIPSDGIASTNWSVGGSSALTNQQQQHKNTVQRSRVSSTSATYTPSSMFQSSTSSSSSSPWLHCYCNYSKAISLVSTITVILFLLGRPEVVELKQLLQPS